jgi:hypothetical protein
VVVEIVSLNCLFQLFGESLFEEYLKQAKNLNINDNDLIATLTELTATTVVDALRKFAPKSVFENNNVEVRVFKSVIK